MFYINKEQLQSIVDKEYKLSSFTSFYNSLDKFLSILTQSDCFNIEFENLFQSVCKKCQRRAVKNHLLLISIDGSISIGKSTLIKKIAPNLKPQLECIILNEPLSIWQCIYHQESGLNILEMFYKAIDNRQTNQSIKNIDFLNIINMIKNKSVDSIKQDHDMPYYFQSLVIFSRWLVLVYSKSNVFLSERSVYSDRYLLLKFYLKNINTCFLKVEFFMKQIANISHRFKAIIIKM